MQSSAAREAIFNRIEKIYGHKFDDELRGLVVYEYMLGLIIASGCSDAVEEFRERFEPLIEGFPLADAAD
jgi:hypothetical protein